MGNKKHLITCKSLLVVLLSIFANVVFAQEGNKFSPEKFDADMNAFIVRKARLTPQEADRLLPIIKQMHSRQRSVYGRLRNVSKTLHEHSNDEAACRKALIERDKLTIELKTIEQKFHHKMLQVAPASKVLAVVEAEDGFFRHAMKQWQHRPRAKKPQ